VTTNAFPPKNWQVKYAKRVLRKITELTGVEFESHLTNEVTKEDAAEYLSTQSALEVNTKSLWDVKFDGVTRNPPQTETQFYTEGIEDSQRNEGSSWYNRTMYVDKDCLMPCYTHMRQYNKKGICDFYVQNNVLDNLFPVTRSCENSGNFKPIDHETHCEECWYCRERYWGFGRII